MGTFRGTQKHESLSLLSNNALGFDILCHVFTLSVNRVAVYETGETSLQIAKPGHRLYH